MKTIMTSLVALGLFAGVANAATMGTRISGDDFKTALPRTSNDDYRTALPRAPGSDLGLPQVSDDDFKAPTP